MVSYANSHLGYIKIYDWEDDVKTAMLKRALTLSCKTGTKKLSLMCRDEKLWAVVGNIECELIAISSIYLRMFNEK